MSVDVKRKESEKRVEWEKKKKQMSKLNRKTKANPHIHKQTYEDIIQATKWSPKYEDGIEIARGFSDIAETIHFKLCAFSFVCRSTWYLISFFSMFPYMLGVFGNQQKQQQQHEIVHKNYLIRWICRMHANKNQTERTPNNVCRIRRVSRDLFFFFWSVRECHMLAINSVTQFKHNLPKHEFPCVFP